MTILSRLFEHTQRYVRAVFADRLRQAGFVSYKGEDIHWYRLVNGEVVQAVYFITRHKTLGTWMDIRYGCHPIWIPCVFQKSPYFAGNPDDTQMCYLLPEEIPGSTSNGYDGTTRLIGKSNAPYAEDALIMCPLDLNFGMDVLDRLLLLLDETTTPRACYELHKRVQGPVVERGSTGLMSSCFVDEVLFWEDQALYPICQKYTDQGEFAFNNYKNGCIPGAGKNFTQEWEKCAMLSQLFREGRFQDYLSTFPERAQKNLKLLSKHTGIQTNGSN